MSKQLKKKVKAKPPPAQKEHRLRAVPLGEGLPDLTSMKDELLDMADVLMGREPPPISAGVSTLMEVSDAYYARAAEMTMLIQQREREGNITRGSAHYKFRTGELRTFMEMAKRASEVGSRRITFRQMRIDAERIGRGDVSAFYDLDED